MSPNQHAPLLVAQQVSCQFGNRFVLKDIHLAINGGEIVVLRGANGSGKTTLVRCLAGMMQPTIGEVLWLGRSIGRPDFRRHLGVVGHLSFLYGELSPHDNLLFAARMHGLSNPRKRVEQLLHTVGIQRYSQQCVRQLSEGTRRKVSIARALIHEPKILLFDEPVSGLDAGASEWFEELLLDLRNRGRAICLTTHDGVLAQRLTRRVYSIESGRLIDSVSPLSAHHSLLTRSG